MSPSLRILVIDDDPVMRELLEALLGYNGHRVEVVDSGIAALARLETHAQNFDVVLTDLHMPILQGKELAAKLLVARAPGTLLVGMSGSSPTEDEMGMFDEFLQKPFSPEQFEEAHVRARSRLHAAHSERNAVPSTPEPVLDEAVFARLSGMLPTEQLSGLYALTLSDVSERLERMKASAADGDFDAVHREAHAIKGGCGMVGARELYALAAAAEFDNQTNFDNFEVACDRLKRMLDERTSTKGPTVSN